MSRASVVLREARPEDSEVLVEVWAGVLRRAEAAEQAADVRSVILAAEGDDDVRIVVAEHDGQVAGAVYLEVGTLTPLNMEPAVRVLSPHVLASHRRMGVGRALMDAAVSFAEERGIAHVASAALSASRDANRFLARLSLAPQAMLRVAPTAIVRARLTPARAGGRSSVSQVLAARRSQRRVGVAGAARSAQG